MSVTMQHAKYAKGLQVGTARHGLGFCDIGWVLMAYLARGHVTLPPTTLWTPLPPTHMKVIK